MQTSGDFTSCNREFAYTPRLEATRPGNYTDPHDRRPQTPPLASQQPDYAARAARHCRRHHDLDRSNDAERGLNEPRRWKPLPMREEKCGSTSRSMNRAIELPRPGFTAQLGCDLGWAAMIWEAMWLRRKCQPTMLLRVSSACLTCE